MFSTFHPRIAAGRAFRQKHSEHGKTERTVKRGLGRDDTNKVNAVEKTAETAGLRNRWDIQKNAWLPLATAANSNKPAADDRRKLVNNNPNQSTDTSGGGK